MKPNNRFGLQQLMVLLPTLLVSAVLGEQGMPAIPRLFASLGFGLVLIAGVALWRKHRR